MGGRQFVPMMIVCQVISTEFVPKKKGSLSEFIPFKWLLIFNQATCYESEYERSPLRWWPNRSPHRHRIGTNSHNLGKDWKKNNIFPSKVHGCSLKSWQPMVTSFKTDKVNRKFKNDYSIFKFLITIILVDFAPMFIGNMLGNVL